MSLFKFKKFSLDDSKSAMKLGTDAVILGSFVKSDNSKFILDIGTGSGIIALMLAQNSQADIHAIDIDESSFLQAKDNFNNSNWASRLTAFNISLQKYSLETNFKYDLIVCNPPFFINSLKSGDKRKNISKHNDLLSFDDLICGTKKLLSPKGKFCIILPFNESRIFKNKASENLLFCNESVFIKPKTNKSVNRVIMNFSFHKTTAVQKNLTIRNNNNTYTQEYIELTKKFYLNF